ncbi:hypothetical protein M2303_006318 [Micromonospora sp. H404/HB375]|nr:hypothetical protein [Micromonospora sp. H404/HB375]
MSGAERQPDGEGGAAAHGAVRVDVAAVQRDQFLDQGEADAAALAGAGPGVLDAVEPLEQARHLLGRDADAGVGDPQHGHPVLGVHPHPHRPVEGELQRVAEQVEHHLLPHAPIHVHRLGQGRAVDLEGEAGALDRRPEDAGQVGGHRGQIHRLVAGLHPARLDAGEVEQAVDQLAQAQPVAADDVQLRADPLVGVVQPAAQLVHRPHDQRERGAELVTDVGEEGGLGAVQLGELLGPPLLRLVAAGARDSGRQVPGGQLHEAAVAVVQRPVAVESRHQEPVRRAALLP